MVFINNLKPQVMKPKLPILFLAILLPVMVFSQSFDVNRALATTDDQLFMKHIYTHSVLLQTMQAAFEKKADISNEEANKLVEEKLKELNNPALNELYAQVKPEDVTRIGLLLYLVMGGLTNLSGDYEASLTFGGGFGLFMMFTLGNFILMPELYYMWQGFGAKDGDYKESVVFNQLALSLTMLYIIRMQSINLVFGLSPQFYYALGGKLKADDEPDQDVEFDGEYAANRVQTYLGISAGIMLQNAMMIRLIYGLGVSKMFKNQDTKMYFWGLVLSMPLWSLGGGK
jgi:hypothetical protein